MPFSTIFFWHAGQIFVCMLATNIWSVRATPVCVFLQPRPTKRLREEEDEQEAKRKREEEEEAAEEEEEEEDQKAAMDRLLDEAEQVGLMDLQQVSRTLSLNLQEDMAVFACIFPIVPPLNSFPGTLFPVTHMSRS
jgi:hypothetical protein